MHKHFELYDCGLQPECGGRERRGRQKQGSNELSANLIKNALCGVADGPLYVCASLFRNAFKMRFSVSKLHSRPSNPAYWAPKREGLPTAMERTASKNAPGHQIQLAGYQSEKEYRPQRTGQTTTAQTASKNAPGRQIQLAGPQSEKGYGPQQLRRPRKTGYIMLGGAGTTRNQRNQRNRQLALRQTSTCSCSPARALGVD